MLVHELRAVLRLVQGRTAEPSAAVLDNRTLRSTPESGGRAAYDVDKRTRGAKLHLTVDTLGHLLALHVTPANAGDRSAAAIPTEAVQKTTDRTWIWPMSIEAMSGSNPLRLPPSMALPSNSLYCLRPSAASSSCPDVGWSRARLHGSPASAASPATTSDCQKPWQACTWSPSSSCYSGAQQTSSSVRNTLHARRSFSRAWTVAPIRSRHLRPRGARAWASQSPRISGMSLPRR